MVEITDCDSTARADFLAAGVMRRLVTVLASAAVLFGCASALPPEDVDTAYNNCVAESGNALLQTSYCKLAIDSGQLNRRELADANFMRGLHQQDRGRHQEAIRSFSEAIRADPQYGQAYFYRGWSKQELGNGAAAQVDFKQGYRFDRNPEFKRVIRQMDRALEEDRRLQREEQQRRSRRYSLVYNGMYCRKVQRDSVFRPANEIFINVVVVDENGRASKASLPARGRVYKNIKKGSKRSGKGRRIWTGTAQALTLQVTMWEYDDGGPLVEKLTEVAVDFALTRGTKTLAKHAVKRGATRMAARGGSKAVRQGMKQVDLSAQISRHISSLPKALVGANNDLVGHIGVANLYPDVYGKPAQQYGFAYNIYTAHRRGGADCRVYFQFR